MSHKHLLALLGLSLLGSAALAEPLGTAFTYQGRLVEDGQPAGGWYALRFTLWDAGTNGHGLGQPQLADRVTVSNGLFTVTLDFGVDMLGFSYFRGEARWLEIGVEHYRGTNFVTLAPRQPLTPTPYALYTPAAGSVPASGLTGTVPNANLPGSPTFAGTVQAAQFQGGGAGLTGVIPADNSVTSPKIVDNAVAAVDLASEEASLNKVSGGYLTVTSAGNVGLGMSTPGFPLNFASATGDKISLYGTAVNHYGLGIQSGLLQIHGASASSDIAFGYGSSTNFTEQMRVKGNGNVGIGTSAPAYPLDVRADQAVGRFLSTNSADISVLVLGNAAAAARWLGAVNFNGSSGTQGQISYATNNGLTFDAGGAERLRITPGGGVGIGTTDPAGATLNVAGTVRATQFQGGGASLTGIIPADDSVTSAKILNGAILNADLADNSVNAAKIADSSVTSAKIADGTVAAVDLDSEEASLNKVSGGHLTVTSAGNVGLGMSAPLFPLNFASATGDKISLYGTGANHYGLGIQAGLLQIHGATASSDLAFGYGSSTNFTEQMRIKGNGKVGIGTNNPQAALHIAGNDLLVEALFPSVELKNPNSTATMELIAYDVFNNLTFKIMDVPVMALYRHQDSAMGMEVYGPVSATAFNPSSDRNAKENFAAVSPREMLDKVTALPISRWNFKGDAATPHVGPMAQDFHAAFQTGSDDKHIATVDADGVALAAIQGLNEKVESENNALRSELKAKDAELRELKQRLEALEKRLAR